MPTKDSKAKAVNTPKLELVTDQQRASIIQQRLVQIENEVINAEINLVVEQSMADVYPEGTAPGVGYPGGPHGLAAAQTNYDAAVARLNGLRKLRDDLGIEITEPVVPAPGGPVPVPPSA